MAKKLYTHRQIRKSLKQDDLKIGLEQLWHYAKTNTENLLITVIIVGVIVVLVPLYFRHQSTNELRATSLLDRAMTYASQPVDLNSALVGQGFKSYEEKYQKLQQAFTEVVSTYRGTRAAALAAEGEANAWFYQRQYEKALAAYQTLLDQHRKDFWTPTLQERVGACQESLGKWQAASAIYTALLQTSPDYFNRRAVRVALARCQFHLGQVEAARKALQTEAADVPGSPWAQQARQLLALYGGETK